MPNGLNRNAVLPLYRAVELFREVTFAFGDAHNVCLHMTVIGGSPLYISCSFVPFIGDVVHLCCEGTRRKSPKIGVD